MYTTVAGASWQVLGRCGELVPIVRILQQGSKIVRAEVRTAITDVVSQIAYPTRHSLSIIIQGRRWTRRLTGRGIFEYGRTASLSKGSSADSTFRVLSGIKRIIMSRPSRHSRVVREQRDRPDQIQGRNKSVFRPEPDSGWNTATTRAKCTNNAQPDETHKKNSVQRLQIRPTTTIRVKGLA
jgi:hypothetical protein